MSLELVPFSNINITVIFLVSFLGVFLLTFTYWVKICYTIKSQGTSEYMSTFRLLITYLWRNKEVLRCVFFTSSIYNHFEYSSFIDRSRYLSIYLFIYKSIFHTHLNLCFYVCIHAKLATSYLRCYEFQAALNSGKPWKLFTNNNQKLAHVTKHFLTPNRFLNSPFDIFSNF